MFSLLLFALFVITPASDADRERPLPALRDGSVVSGPGTFRQESPLRIDGHVRLENLTLKLSAPIVVARGAKFELKGVHLIVSDRPGSANGSSNLRCEGPAGFLISDSTMVTNDSAHPIWSLEGELNVGNFQTENAEFHLSKSKAALDRLKIFELEISHASHVAAKHLRLVFLSTHSSEDDHLLFEDVPTDKPFTKKLAMGSGAEAELEDTQLQFFLLYIHGHADATLRGMERVQLAMFSDCQGRMELPRGRLGSLEAPAVFPQPGKSNCPFSFTLQNVNVDSWDVYASGHADLTFERSEIDELNADGAAKLVLHDSEIYADWMAVGGEAQVRVEGGSVGALRLAKERPDLATSQIRLGGHSKTIFTQVRFDCGIVASDQAWVKIAHPSIPPEYIHRSGRAEILD
jgi:hypothetical protein